jgi:hypothetical protein
LNESDGRYFESIPELWDLAACDDTDYRENFSAAAGAALMARLPLQNRTLFKRGQRTGLGTPPPVGGPAIAHGDKAL